MPEREAPASGREVLMVTGASRGIGRALAERYLERGYAVVGVARGPSTIEHDRYHHHLADVGDEEGVLGVMAQVRATLGRVDVLLNNAGIASMNHALTTPGATFRRVLETNVLGSFLFAREAAKLMMPRRRGRIVNFASVAVPLKLAGEAAYAASKAAVVSLTEVLARELAPFGITVNAVGPTPVATDLIKGVPEAKMEALLARQALPRLGTVDDVGNVVDFFIRPESGFVTGQTLYLGGV